MCGGLVERSLRLFWAMPEGHRGARWNHQGFGEYHLIRGVEYACFSPCCDSLGGRMEYYLCHTRRHGHSRKGIARVSVVGLP
jgi:hypothetical protein